MDSKLKNRSDITHLERPDGTMTQSDAETAEQLNKYFESTFTMEEDRNIPTIPTRITETLSDINISEEAIFYKLISLNGNKAPGLTSSFPEIMCCLFSQASIFINKAIIELWYITRPLEESQRHTHI